MPAPQWHHGHRVRPLGVPTTQETDVDDPDDVGHIPASQPQAGPPPSTLERPAGCINRHSTPPFALLCSVMDRMRSEEAGKRRETLSRFMALWRVKVGNDLYPLVRLLLPDRDRERPVYNLKEAMLAKCYIEVLGLDKHSEAAQRLIKWKQPVDGQNEGHSGDFARVCYHEIAARSTVEEGTLTIDAVNSLLDEMARGRLKQAEYVPVLRRVIQQCTPVEQEWIIRIILKDLRISIREKGVFQCLHPDAADLFNVCSDLKRVCWTLYKPEIRLEKHQTNIELFRSFLPQLCYRSPSSSHDAVAKLVGAPSEFVMEEKLDGERIQLHMRGSGAQWAYYSRKSKDYTYLYGAHVGEGSLTQHIAGALQDGVRNVILDGEMLVWDPILEKYLAFGTLKTAAGDKINDENGPRPCFKVFDILYLNDRCLTNIRLSERKRLLRSGRVFKDLDNFKGRIEYADEGRGKSGKDILAMLERILETKGEGLVVKRIDSVYQTNARGADWVKVKPEYSDQMGENLDLLVLGGWWGKGGRTGKISSLLCGLRVTSDDDGSGARPIFTTFASVGSGMSYEDYEWILKKHKDHWTPFDKNNPPDWMQLGATGNDDKPDVYINPENSFVIEVKGSEITPAVGNYGCGYTLRFPRCKYIYWDRNSHDHAPSDEKEDRDMWNCLSLDEFLALLHRPSKRYQDDGEGTQRRKRRRAITQKKVEILGVSSSSQVESSPAETAIFDGMTFYIPKDAPTHTKSELEQLVLKHGGQFTQAQLGDGTALVISNDDKTPRVKAQIRQGHNVVKPVWIFESIERRRALPLIEELCVNASEEMKDGRYYHKKLAQLDDRSLVRDRTGSRLHADLDEDEEVDGQDEQVEQDVQSAQLEGLKEENESPEPLIDMSPTPAASANSLRQIDMEKEWGLWSTARGAKVEEDEDDTDSDRGRRNPAREEEEEAEEEAYEDDEQAVDSHDSTPEQDSRLLPVHGVDKPPEGHVPLGDGADAYDEEKIFTHLVFYIDKAGLAEKNGLEPSKPPKAAEERLDEAERLLRAHGGSVVDDLHDPAVTHVVMDDDDSGRYAAIVRGASKPRRKHIVTPSWVTDSVDEETLMDEDAHKPR
ncbi:DNA ligase (ATP) [Cryptotrichosporon argae]